MKALDSSFEVPPALVDAASAVQAIFVAATSSFMEACIAANERGFAACQLSTYAKPSLWDLRGQVLASSKTANTTFSIDVLLDMYYARNKDRTKTRFEENARWIVKKLLDVKQFPTASAQVLEFALQVSNERVIEEGMLGDAKSYAGSQVKKGSGPLARLSTLTPRAHEALIRFRVGDHLDVAAKGGEMPEQHWLVVRNRLAVFTNLQDDGYFTLAGVHPEVVDGWWTDVLLHRGRGQQPLSSMDGLLLNCEKEVSSDAITDPLEIKHVIATWLRRNVPWVKLVVARKAADAEAKVETSLTSFSPCFREKRCIRVFCKKYR